MELLSAVLPVPSWPPSLRPQQKTLSLVVTPQVNCDPAATWRNRSPPDTATGRKLQGRELHGSGESSGGIPSSPNWFAPQHQALPSLVTPQACSTPALTWRKVSVATAAAGAPPDSREGGEGGSSRQAATAGGP